MNYPKRKSSPVNRNHHASVVLMRIGIILTAMFVCFTFVSCSMVDLRYYTNTNVPTFTCVTNVEVSETSNVAGFTCYTYEVSAWRADSLMNKYIKYLQKQDFVIVDSSDGYENMVTLAKGQSGVIVSKADSDIINVLPYGRSSY